MFVLDARGRHRMPYHPALALRLPTQPRVTAMCRAPSTVEPIDPTLAEGTVHPVTVTIVPGSTSTGVAVSQVDDAGGHHGLCTVGLCHRAQHQIHLARERRSRDARDRDPRSHPRQPAGWAAPSPRHRVGTTMAWANRLRRAAPVTAAAAEPARPDTQTTQDPEMSGLAYQQGRPAGYEVREYVLETWDRRCVYRDALDVPQARSLGGTDGVSNLAPARVGCSQAKGDRYPRAFVDHATAGIGRAVVPTGKKKAALRTARVTARARRFFDISTPSGRATGVPQKLPDPLPGRRLRTLREKEALNAA